MRAGRAWPRLRWVLVRLLALLLLLESALFVFQRRLLYHPTTYTPAELAPQSQAAGLRPWPAAADYRGLLEEPSASSPKGTILHLHGNAGSALDWSGLRESAVPLGFRLIMLEYPGYGARPGSPSEAALVADATRSVELARAQFGAPLFLFGESLGSGVAAATVATAGKHLDGVLLATAWDNLPRVAQKTFWFLPVKWLVLDRYDSVRNLASYPGPLAVVLAERDELIPKECTQRLFTAFAGRKRMWALAHATHNNWQDFTPPGWWQEVMSFLSGR